MSKERTPKGLYTINVRDNEGGYVGFIKFYLQSEKVEEFEANYTFVEGMLIITTNIPSIGPFVHIKKASHDVRTLFNLYPCRESCTIKLEQGFRFDEEDFKRRTKQTEQSFSLTEFVRGVTVVCQHCGNQISCVHPENSIFVGSKEDKSKDGKFVRRQLNDVFCPECSNLTRFAVINQLPTIK